MKVPDSIEQSDKVDSIRNARPNVLSTGRAQRFTSRGEAELARPRLSADNPVCLAEFADLVGDYRFPKPEWIRCQLVDEKGRCKKLHGWGWVAQLADGTEGYIGHDCADDHFKADPRFAGKFANAVARVDREITTDLAVARLGRLIADPRIRVTLDTAMRRRNRLSDRLSRLRNLLPPVVFKKLVDRAKRGDAAVMVRILYVEIETDEKTKRRREVVTPKQLRWGILTGLEGLDDRPLLKIGKRLAEADTALLRAVAAVDQPVTSMRKWAAALEYVDRVAADLEKHEALIDGFTRPENLKLLWLLAEDRFDQLAVVNAAVEITTQKRVTDEQAETARDAWSQEIEDAHGGRKFQLVG